MWPPIRLLKQSPSSCIRVTSQSLGPQPGSWAIRVQTSWTALLMRCVNSSAWRSCKPCLITPRQMGWWRGLIEPLCNWLGSWEMIKKADWQGNLAEIMHTFNATQSAMTGYSPHYLMFGCRSRLPVDFYFPTLRSTEVPRYGAATKYVLKYVATVWDPLRATLQEAQAQSMAKAWIQKWYYDWKIGNVGLKPGNLILVKADTFQGKRKIKDRWEEKPHEVVHQITTDVPLYEVKDQHGCSCVLHHNWLLLVTSETGVPLCVDVHKVQDRCTSPTPVKPTPRGSDRKTMPQADDGLATTQHQARMISLGWINGKLCFSHGCQLDCPLRMGEDSR